MQKNKSQPENDDELEILLNFEGLHDPSDVTPPDPVGDIGKNHYVQMVNTSSGGLVSGMGQTGKLDLRTRAYQHDLEPGKCHQRRRPNHPVRPCRPAWAMMEFTASQTNELLLAVSNTSDPTSGWKAYRFSTLGFPDYPKLMSGTTVILSPPTNRLMATDAPALPSNVLKSSPAPQTFRYTGLKCPTPSCHFPALTGADWGRRPASATGKSGVSFPGI